jgi:beta-lactamase class A
MRVKTYMLRYMKNKGYLIITLLIIAFIFLLVPGGSWLHRTEDILIAELENTPGTEIHDSPAMDNRDPWISNLEQKIAGIDENTAGRMGVYVRQAGDDGALTYNVEDPWYLSSTIKIPVAVAILQRVEAGEFSLDDELTIYRSDFVDGAGDILRQEPGSRYSIAVLLEKMIKNSDSSATDKLIRLMGEDGFNSQIRERMVSEGFNRITTILQVRYDAYSEFHENISILSNVDILYVHSTRSRPERVKRLIERMNIDESELKVSTIEEAFERYYRRGLNSASLESFGLLLERLYNGELLSEYHTAFLLETMEGITTGDRRIKAGLPPGTRFAHKTGTQIESACNVGLILRDDGREPVIIAACVENFGDITEAEKALEYTGRVVAETLMD